jgi:hypothetical protein
MANALEFLVEQVLLELIEQQPGISDLTVTRQDSDSTASKDRIIIKAELGGDEESEETETRLPRELSVSVEARIQKRSQALNNAALQAIWNGLSNQPATTPAALAAFDGTGGYFKIIPSTGSREAARDTRRSSYSFTVWAKLDSDTESAGEFLLQDGTTLLLQTGETLLLQS